jgi:hypothetical protein
LDLLEICLGIAPLSVLAQTAPMKTAFLLILAVLAIAGLWLALRYRRDNLHRQRVISQLLDAADALEARLRAARSEIEAIAGDHVNPVRAAMQDLLQQRLWLQDNAQQASLAQLEEVRQTMDNARASLELQLQRVERARAGHAP